MKRPQKDYKSNCKTSKIIIINTYLSIITLTVHGLDAPIKRHRLTEWIKTNKEQQQQNKTHLYAAYPKLTSDLKTHVV